MKKYTSRGSNALKGFLAGSLIIGSIINPYLIPIQLILFLMGLAVLLDALFLFGKNVHPATTSLMALLGVILSVAFTLIQYASFYLAIIVFVTILLYIYIFLARERMVKEPEEKG